MQYTIEPSLRGRNLTEYATSVRPAIDRALLCHLPIVDAPGFELLNDALKHAVFPGGKRLRPMLTILGAEVVGGCLEEVLSAAVAMEYVHTSSLIFDDLPCMDDARQRRGKASLHVRYGEAVAVLVALTLINASYSLILNNKTFDVSLTKRAHSEFVKAAEGLINGQFLDLTISNAVESHSQRNLKTSALMSIAVQIGAILSGASQQQLSVLSQFGRWLGEAFQTNDDLIDLKVDLSKVSSPLPISERQIFIRSREERFIETRFIEIKELLVQEFSSCQPALLLSQVHDYVTSGEA